MVAGEALAGDASEASGSDGVGAGAAAGGFGVLFEHLPGGAFGVLLGGAVGDGLVDGWGRGERAGRGEIAISRWRGVVAKPGGEGEDGLGRGGNFGVVDFSPLGGKPCDPLGVALFRVVLSGPLRLAMGEHFTPVSGDEFSVFVVCHCAWVPFARRAVSKRRLCARDCALPFARSLSNTLIDIKPEMAPARGKRFLTYPPRDQ